MANSFSKMYVHYVFSTKYRKPLISPAFEARLWDYLGGIAEHHQITPLRISGTEDHIHALVILPPPVSVSKGIQLLKGGSSKWVNDHYFPDRTFKWHKGYGAFSVSESKIPAVTRYIDLQKQHHRTQSFKQEYLMFLKQYQVDFDERYVFS